MSLNNGKKEFVDHDKPNVSETKYKNEEKRRGGTGLRVLFIAAESPG
jgi:hypothetical protein